MAKITTIDVGTRSYIWRNFTI